MRGSCFVQNSRTATQPLCKPGSTSIEPQDVIHFFADPSAPNCLKIEGSGLLASCGIYKRQNDGLRLLEAWWRKADTGFYIRYSLDSGRWMMYDGNGTAHYGTNDDAADTDGPLDRMWTTMSHLAQMPAPNVRAICLEAAETPTFQLRDEENKLTARWSTVDQNTDLTPKGVSFVKIDMAWYKDGTPKNVTAESPSSSPVNMRDLADQVRLVHSAMSQHDEPSSTTTFWTSICCCILPCCRSNSTDYSDADRSPGYHYHSPQNADVEE